MANSLIGKLVADKYRVERLIRESDSGDLYEGRHEISGAPATLRIVPQALAMDLRWSERFLEQARKSAAIDHPNILQTTDFGTDSRGIVYAVHEPFSLTTIADLKQGGGELGQARALDITSQVAAVATVAHARASIHAGLTPREIFVDATPDGDQVKVLGFGADSILVPQDADKKYLAPEQQSEFAVADERSDIFSLGLILAEMLTGDTTVESLDAKKAELHPKILPILVSATDRSKEARYQSMADFSQDLKRVLAEVGGKKAVAAHGGIWKTAAVVFIGIAFLGGVLIYGTMGKKTDPTTELVADLESLPVQPISGATGIQEDTLVKMVGDVESGLMDNTNMAVPPGTLPGGDGYNAWSGSGAPPIGAPAPLAGEMPVQVAIPGGQTVTIDPTTPSQFMPQEGGVMLVPIPSNSAPESSTTPATKPAADVGTVPSATPKQMATPAPRPNRSNRTAKPTPAPKPTTERPNEN